MKDNILRLFISAPEGYSSEVPVIRIRPARQKTIRFIVSHRDGRDVSETEPRFHHLADNGALVVDFVIACREKCGECKY